MTNRLNVVLLIFTLFILFSAGEIHYSQNKNSEFRRIENKAFAAGETLRFEVRYGFVTAGIAEFSIPRTVKIAGREVYNVVFKVNSIPAFDMFYKVRDRYETYIDTEGIFPWRFEQHIREGGYSRDFSAFFDQRRGIARTSEGSYEIPKYVNDIVSAFYYARTYDFSNMKPGDKIQLENFYKDKVYPLDVIYRGKETINVDAGEFKCIILEPIIREGGLFKSEGTIVIWMTDDELKIPVKVKTKILIGSIDADLIYYEGLKSAPKSKIN
ncbi:hypothetical protein MROS_0887 [Melioribacter roseus P3M-2]|uniref:DUF3108 domain-containing protein n=1 Tax=Melioribacter roseus (strain DSM 23840 / JCM 17771 / VKM B-2668 / P3M-2) TaxID=1191523 RepID=I6ZYM9_MELRP|nr:DUF3108 domain-containing protein [Melioribacter roseus]AFN74128.1 hypothetical protein MROS_0887 [Melioribacter roseus P3M-2]